MGTEFLRFNWIDFSDVTTDVKQLFILTIFPVGLSVEGVGWN